MKDNVDNQINKLIDKSIKKASLETPSLGFTNSVMAQVNALKQSTVTTYRPLISKPAWFVIFTVALLMVLYIIFGTTTTDAGWLSFIDLSFISNNRFSNTLSGFNVSNSVAYAVVLFGLMLFIQVPILKHYFDKRLDPRVLVPGAKSVVSLLLNYHSKEKQTDVEAPKIASYAFGDDYHKVIKDKLKKLMSFIHKEIGEVQGRVFVDSAPVMDKAWAAKSGLGWIGKNTNLISKKAGSFFFIAELILDLELEHDLPATDHCGSCTACIDACPTDALIAPYQIDAKSCHSQHCLQMHCKQPSVHRHL